MPLQNSSISSSSGSAESAGGAVRVLGWVVVWTLALDLCASLLFPASQIGAGGIRGQLASYFGHGLSTQTQLIRAAADPDGLGGRMIRAGWVDPLSWQDQPSTMIEGQRHLAAFYGNSFARQIGELVAQSDRHIGARVVFGPVAPPSHAHATFVADRGLHEADVAVLGILAPTVAGMVSMTRATQSVMEPNPYTYPRYRVVDGSLEAEEPVIGSAAAFQQALADETVWNRHTSQLSEHDDFYIGSLFNADVFERSTLVKLLRTAWAIRHQRSMQERVRDRNGFMADSEAAEVLRALLVDFAQTAREDGQRPIVLVMSTPAFGGDLDVLLRGFLGQREIAAIHATDLCAASDPENYVGDGHFSDRCAGLISTRLRNWIHDIR